MRHFFSDSPELFVRLGYEGLTTELRYLVLVSGPLTFDLRTSYKHLVKLFTTCEDLLSIE